MKFAKLLALLIVIPILFGLISCSKGPGKKEVIEVYSKLDTFLTDPQLKKTVVDDLKNTTANVTDINVAGEKIAEASDQLSKKIEKEMNDLVAKNGFKNRAEFDSINKQLKDDADFKTAMGNVGKSFNKLVMDLQMDIESIKTEIQKKAQMTDPSKMEEQPKMESEPAIK